MGVDEGNLQVMDVEMIRFVLFLYFSFIETAALRSIVLRFAHAPAATRNWVTSVCVIYCYFVFFIFGGMPLFSEHFHHFHLLFAWRVHYTFPLRTMSFFYLVTTD